MDILLANPRGFCAGVDRAIEIVKRAIETLGAPIYVRHEVVHNKFVVDDLKARGAVFVEELDEVPDGNTVIFSAHGVSQAVRLEADRRGLKVFDATCPLVTKVHLEVARQCRNGRDMVLIGHAGHPEVEGRGDVQRLEVFHPVERHMVVRPAAAHRNGNFVGVLAFEVPVIDRRNVLDDIHRMDGPIRFDFKVKGHRQQSHIGDALKGWRTGSVRLDTQELDRTAARREPTSRPVLETVHRDIDSGDAGTGRFQGFLLWMIGLLRLTTS